MMKSTLTAGTRVKVDSAFYKGMGSIVRSESRVADSVGYIIDTDDRNGSFRSDGHMFAFDSEFEVVATAEKFQNGDKAIITSRSSAMHGFSIGDTVTITDDSWGEKRRGGHDYQISIPGTRGYADAHNLKLVQEAPYRVGETVRVTQRGFHFLEIGAEAKVLSVSSEGTDGERRYHVEGMTVKGFESPQIVRECDIAAMPKVELKVGDKVKIVNDETESHRFEIGDIATIIKVDKRDDRQPYLCEDREGESECGWVTKKDVVLASREELDETTRYDVVNFLRDLTDAELLDIMQEVRA
ncbi:hypothetical protein [Rossellomorea marisflavi]|uniref:hypothetical protein n=1 Tax=Rossellomorea marisflavi TaxID=189381 RepID=UPI0009A56511|nr:hypothetical protein [Rossellomorea marisflavi]